MLELIDRLVNDTLNYRCHTSMRWAGDPEQ